MYMCSTFLNFEEFLLDLTFWIMWTKLWSWNQMFLTIIFSTLYLFLFSISSPLSWRTWSVLENMHWCNKSEFCLSADDEAPILNCPNISSTTDEGLHSSSTVLLSSTATDNVDFHLDVNCSHSSQDTYLIGDTTVNCSSTDDAGNTGTCLLVVTVTGVNMIISISKSSVTNRAKDFGIFNFFWKMNRHQCICVLQFLTSRSFCLI